MKRKLVNNKKHIKATGGGPSREIPLSGMEEEVVALLQLEVAVEGIEGVSSYGIMAASSEPSTSAAISGYMEEVLDSPLNDYHSDIQTGNVGSESPANTRKRRREEDSTLELLKEQINIQRNLAKCVENGVNVNATAMKDLINETTKIRKVSEKMYEVAKKSVKLQEEIVELKKRKLEEIKNHNLKMEKLLEEKIEMKREIVNFQLSELNNNP